MNAFPIPGPPSTPEPKPLALPLDESRGTWGIMLTILTEAFLFISLFSSYFFLAIGRLRWNEEQPPKLHFALPMLGILILSSFVLYWGERNTKQRRYGAGRAALIGTIVLGLIFLTLSAFDYRERWDTLMPQSDSYGSIFYTLVSFHAAHVIVGLLMLAYVLFLPRYAPAERTPYRPYHVVSLYWHFVDVVWIFIVAILYVTPNLVRA